MTEKIRKVHINVAKINLWKENLKFIRFALSHNKILEMDLLKPTK